MKRFFAGVDISKNWVDFAILDKQSNQIIKQKRIDNKSKRLTSFCDALIKNYGKEAMWFCFEHTGHFGLKLACVLEELEVDYCAVPALEIKNSLGVQRGKNDLVDASRIAQYAATHSHKLKVSKLPAKTFMQVKQLLTYRNQLVKTRSSFKNSLKAHQLAEEAISLEKISHNIQKQINSLDEEIKQVEVKINELLTNNEEIRKNLHLIKSVKGIGSIIAATIIVLTQNFSTFDNPRKFNCYSGLAPFEHSSGMSKVHSRTSMLRNKEMKTLMMNAANTAAVHDPQLKAYFQRKFSEGKVKYAILNAVACKLIYRVFATVKRETPYVILQN